VINRAAFAKYAGRNKGAQMAGRILKAAVVLLIAAVVVAPFYVSVVYSLKTPGDLANGRLSIPTRPTLENYYRVITENQFFLTGFKNSIVNTIPTVLILLVITSMASFVLARNRGAFYNIMYNVFLSGILIPFQCIMLPLYLNMYRMGLTSSNLGFILARTGFQVSISILTVTGFIKTVPRDLEEAACIDGCNRLQTFWRVVFPLITPVNVTQMVLNTLFVWNDYNVAIVLLRDDASRTLPLAQIIYFNENTSQLNLAFAFFMMAMLPILILYLCTQKYIVSGIMAGAVKG